MLDLTHDKSRYLEGGPILRDKEELKDGWRAGVVEKGRADHQAAIKVSMTFYAIKGTIAVGKTNFLRATLRRPV